jgi:hypothetical protein
MMSRILRFLVSILIAASIVASPVPKSLARGTNQLAHSPNHLPHKQHQRSTCVVNTQMVWGAFARSSSRNRQELKPRAVKPIPTLTARSLARDYSANLAGPQRAFRPLRC